MGGILHKEKPKKKKKVCNENGWDFFSWPLLQIMIYMPKNYVSPDFYQMKQEVQHTGEAWKEQENGVKGGTHFTTQSLSRLAHVEYVTHRRHLMGQFSLSTWVCMHALSTPTNSVNLCCL